MGPEAMGTPSSPVAMTGTTGLDAGNTASSEKGRDVEAEHRISMDFMKFWGVC